MNFELIELIERISKKRNISQEKVAEIIKNSILLGYKKKYGKYENIEIDIDLQSGEIKIWKNKIVVENFIDENKEIILKEAKKINSEIKIGDQLLVPLSIEKLGRIVAIATGQTIGQFLEEEEQKNIYEEYKSKIGTCISSVIQRLEKKDVILDIDRIEGLLPLDEQIPETKFKPGNRIRVYILDVRKCENPQIIVSQTHPELVKQLFEMEIPEITEKIIKIASIARLPGIRTKIAIYSTRPDIDPVGTCIGVKGSRIQVIIKELQGEKIDIIVWNEKIQEFIKKSLCPAQISKVILNEKNKSSIVIVPDDQLSLAIGKNGQNVKLAVKLTGWKMDIQKESLFKKTLELEEKKNISLKEISGIGEKTLEFLIASGIDTVEKLAITDLVELQKIHGIGNKKAEKLQIKAKNLLEK
ncbi:MAG: transcription termination factor NusA [bacterium]